MVGFYKHDIPAWMDGTEALSDGAYRVYHVILQLIMLNEGPITRNDRGIAGRCNQTVKAFGRCLDELVAAGKLAIADGRIDNARAAIELQSIMKNRENAGKGGKTRAFRQETQKNAAAAHANPLENNAPVQAALELEASLKEKRREDTPKAPKGAVSDKVFFRETFWPLYPKREGGNPADPAEASFVKAIRNGANRDDIVAGLRGFVTACRSSEIVGTKFVPMAATWLNQGRWKEHLAVPVTHAGNAPSAYLDTLTEDRWKAEVQTWKTTLGQWNLAKWTPAPDHPATKVPRHILEGFSIQPRPFQPSLVMGRAA